MEYEITKHRRNNFAGVFLTSIDKRDFHFHRDMEIFLVIDGSVRVNDGKATYLLKKDDIFLANKNELHGLERTQEQNLLLVLQFDQEMCADYYPRISNIRFTGKRIAAECQMDGWEELRRVILRIAECYAREKEGYYLKLIALVNLLMYGMIRRGCYVEKDKKTLLSESRNSERLYRIVDCIHRDYKYNITLKGLAEQENLNMYYLSHFIKANLGMSFQQYLTEIRTENAEYLLLNSDLNNMDIYLECGFSDYKYLVKAFVQKFGCTPAQYRAARKTARKEGARAPMGAIQQHIIDDGALILETMRRYGLLT